MNGLQGCRQSLKGEQHRWKKATEEDGMEVKEIRMNGQQCTPAKMLHMDLFHEQKIADDVCKSSVNEVFWKLAK